jgi:selenide,water dikinase
MAPPSDPNLLVGAEHFSDAGVYRLTDELAVVQTLDFFAPVVDEPFVFGQIAAANSLSDVYAVGGQPRTALNIVGFPYNDLDLSDLEAILDGGTDRVQAAGATIVGGHSVRDTEVKYGLSVTGIVHPRKMLRNDAARPGDMLVLTKGLGTGLVIAANRGDRCPPEVLDAACASMIELNRAAAEAAVDVGAKAATDVTGFGLAGHAFEMTQAGGVTFEFELHRLPVLPGVLPLATVQNFTGAVGTNRDHVAPAMRFLDRAEESQRVTFLFDPQTSGGLLIALPPDRAGELLQRCRDGGNEVAAIIGSVTDRGEADLLIRP